MKKIYFSFFICSLLFLWFWKSFALSPVSTDSETPKMCTMEYAPVCGKSPAKTCMGPGCASEEKTYSNKCMLEWDNATYLYTGECTKEAKKLPEATKTKYYMGDTNSCMMIKFACETGWEYFSDTLGCGCEKKIQISPELSLSIKNRLNVLIEQFIKKLEAKNYSDEKNISLIDIVITKLSTLQIQEKYTAIAKYTIQLLQTQKAKYQDDLSIIEEILK